MLKLMLRFSLVFFTMFALADADWTEVDGVRARLTSGRLEAALPKMSLVTICLSGKDNCLAKKGTRVFALWQTRTKDSEEFSSVRNITLVDGLNITVLIKPLGDAKTIEVGTAFVVKTDGEKLKLQENLDFAALNKPEPYDPSKDEVDGPSKEEVYALAWLNQWRKHFGREKEGLELDLLEWQFASDNSSEVANHIATGEKILHSQEVEAGVTIRYMRSHEYRRPYEIIAGCMPHGPGNGLEQFFLGNRSGFGNLLELRFHEELMKAKSVGIGYAKSQDGKTAGLVIRFR